MKQDLAFITKGLNFTGRFAFDSYSDQNITRTKNPDLYRVEPQRNSSGELIFRKVKDAQPLSQSSSNGGNRRTYVEAA